MKKHFIVLPVKDNDFHLKNYGDNKKLALRTAQMYFDADNRGYISLIERSSYSGLYFTRLPSVDYLENPASHSEPWIYLQDYEKQSEVIAAARIYGSNGQGKIQIVKSGEWEINSLNRKLKSVKF